MLRAISVTKRFEDGASSRTVLRDFSLDIDRGERVALTGPSGSGKTTLLNLFAGLLTPEAGEIWFDTPETPLPISSMSRQERSRFRRHHVGYVFQFFNLVPTLTVAENLRLPLVLTGREALFDEALARLDELGLKDRANDFPSKLSGGEQQRVAIARAVVHRPSLVLADEPTGNLDADNAERVIELLWRHTRDVGAALVVATHSERIANAVDRRIRLAP